MLEDDNKSFVGVFDSGLGGLSVLEEMLSLLPHENFVYFGDSANAPYGTKNEEEILELTSKNILMLKEMGAKAVVLACNTATSVAAGHLRKKYKDMPIIGVEPAIKPAVLDNPKEKIIVMATPATLKGKQFINLAGRYEESSKLVSIPCEGLMEFVERGELQGGKLEHYLKEKLQEEIKEKPAAIVLGCTHYPFVKKEIINIVGEGIKIYDGGLGTAKQLKRVLQANGMLKESGEGSLEILNSGGKEFVERSKALLKTKIWRLG